MDAARPVAAGQHLAHSPTLGISMTHVFRFRSAICVLLTAALIATVGVDSSIAKDAPASKVDRAKVSEAVNKAADFLKQAQANDGSYSGTTGPGVTALVGAALLRSGRTPQ